MLLFSCCFDCCETPYFRDDASLPARRLLRERHANEWRDLVKDRKRVKVLWVSEILEGGETMSKGEMEIDQRDRHAGTLHKLISHGWYARFFGGEKTNTL